MYSSTLPIQGTIQLPGGRKPRHRTGACHASKQLYGRLFLTVMSYRNTPLCKFLAVI